MSYLHKYENFIYIFNLFHIFTCDCDGVTVAAFTQ